jgi:ADP-ribose pyrophosphatase YjhB (NUDIX family)
MSILIAADLIIEKDDKILLIRRGSEPFKGKLALPGGHLEYKKGEKLEEAAIREAKEETNIDVDLKKVFNVYSGKERDPRGYSISVVFIAKPLRGKPKAKSDAASLGWFDPKSLKKNMLAFDHYKIIKDYVKYKNSEK